MSKYYSSSSSSSSSPKEDPPLVPSSDGTCMVLGREYMLKKCLHCHRINTIKREKFVDAVLKKKYDAIKMEIDKCEEFDCRKEPTDAIFIYQDKGKKKIEDYFSKQKKKPK